MKLKNLYIGYTKTLLEIEELNLEAGKVYALIGANGRGKTTFMKSLIGQIPSLSGQITLDGKDLTTLLSLDKSKLFGFVNSRFAGVSYMRAKEYVALGRSPYTKAFGRLSAKDEAIVDQSFETMEIEHLANKFTEDLSDGERQMLAIAKVLAQETEYIFLDEPTAFLDYSNKKKVLQMLTKIAKDENKCIFYSSHDLEMALEYSDVKVCVLKENNQVSIISGKLDLNSLLNICFQD